MFFFLNVKRNAQFVILLTGETAMYDVCNDLSVLSELPFDPTVHAVLVLLVINHVIYLLFVWLPGCF